MRTIKHVTLVLLMIALAFTGCKKDTPTQEGQSLSANDLRLSKMISDFKTKGQCKLKSTETMSIDSVVWYLEAATNYTYGDGSKTTEQIASDSAFFLLPINAENQILFSDVWNNYEKVIDSLRSYYKGLNYSEKQLIAVDVKVVDPQGLKLKSANVIGSNIELEVTSTFAVGPVPFEHSCDFNSTTSYRWWSGCVPWPGLPPCPTDAAEQIQGKIHACQAMPIGNVWYSDTETHSNIGIFKKYPNPNWNGIPNYYQFLTFENSSGLANYHEILSPTECNFYLNGLKWIIYTPESQGGERPDNKSFMTVDVKGDGFFPNGSSLIFHYANIQYGILHVSNDPPTPL